MTKDPIIGRLMVVCAICVILYVGMIGAVYVAWKLDPNPDMGLRIKFNEDTSRWERFLNGIMIDDDINS